MLINGFKCFIIALSLVMIEPCYPQSGENGKRMGKLTNSVVKILLGDQVYGTGFLVDERGYFATCWHVVDYSFAIKDRQLVKTGDIFVEFVNGKRFRAELHPVLSKIPNAFNKMRDFDITLLFVKDFNPDFKLEPLELASWKEIQEFDDIYVAGYPLATLHISFSVGKLSSKHEKNFKVVDAEGKRVDSYARQQAYADLTINSGNSGGPAIIFDKKSDKERVVGLAAEGIDFPFGEEVLKYRNKYRELIKEKGDEATELEKETKLVFERLYMMPSGIGLIISNDFLIQLLGKIDE